MASNYPDVILPQPSATVLDRIKYLRFKAHKTQAQFAELIGIDPSSISKILSGKMAVTDHLINRLVANLGVSKQWLESGEGLPYDKPAATTTLEAATIDPAATKGAPVYDIDVTAGCLPLGSQFTSQNIIGYIDIPSLDPQNPVVKVSGDSMQPRIPNGSFISIRRIKDPSILHWGAPYVIELEDYRLVKVVKPCKNDPSKIVLHSENPDYDDIEVKRSAVLRYYLVEAILNYQTLI